MLLLNYVLDCIERKNIILQISPFYPEREPHLIRTDFAQRLFTIIPTNSFPMISDYYLLIIERHFDFSCQIFILLIKSFFLSSLKKFTSFKDKKELTSLQKRTIKQI